MVCLTFRRHVCFGACSSTSVMLTTGMTFLRIHLLQNCASLMLSTAATAPAALAATGQAGTVSALRSSP